MTKEALLKAVTEGELFKTIDQSEEFSQFIHDRENQIGLDVTEDPEYKRTQTEKRRLEAEFKSLYADKTTGEKKVLLFDDLVERQGAISDMAHYEAGFTEGVKFIIGILTE